MGVRSRGGSESPAMRVDVFRTMVTNNVGAAVRSRGSTIPGALSSRQHQHATRNSKVLPGGSSAHGTGTSTNTGNRLGGGHTAIVVTRFLVAL